MGFEAALRRADVNHFYRVAHIYRASSHGPCWWTLLVGRHIGARDVVFIYSSINDKGHKLPLACR